jgi:CubicO group peptidase (beta-lactamase class C family)
MKKAAICILMAGLTLGLMHQPSLAASSGMAFAPAVSQGMILVEDTQTPSITGTSVPALQGFDDTITGLMAKWQIPGAALAVVNDGRLVLAHGYGLADVDANQPVQPDSLFRIASLSKTFTAAGILTLVEQGKLDLDAPAFPLISQFSPPTGTKPDPRLAKITVRQLLQHTGGWDRDESRDPVFLYRTVAAALGVPSPAGCPDVIRYMMGQPLDFDPGTRYAYSNFGYCVLGRIIEKASGQPYVDFITNQILTPAGITRMREGYSLADRRAEGEVHYYDYPGAPLVPSLFPGTPGQVPNPYGGFSIETMDSFGAWLASPIDLVRFLAALDGRRPPRLLKPETIDMMTARPAPPVWVDTPSYYGLGFLVRPLSGGANWWHNGSLPGTRTFMARFENGWTWAVVFNTRSADSDKFILEVDQSLSGAGRSVKDWPTNDLFSQYP